ncbi:MAG: hypothetical protein WBA74_08555, partial [Cyclobacteriaceae bacterium]
MHFKYDIILSYATEDDRHLTGTDKGWVTNFKKFLVTLFGQISKATPRILEVTELDEVEETEDQGGVYIAILSEAFFRHQDLVRSLKMFADAAESHGNLELSGIGRLFKVVKQPIN